MSSIRIVVRHGESVSRPEQPELWVQGEKIPSGVEKGFDLVVGEPFNIEAKLTEDQTKAAKDVEEADKKIDEERRSGKKISPRKSPQSRQSRQGKASPRRPRPRPRARQSKPSRVRASTVKRSKAKRRLRSS